MSDFNPLHQNQMPMQQQSFEVGADETFPQIDFRNIGLHEDGKKIDFPEIEYYGFKHGDQTAKLGIVILSFQGKEANTPENLRAVWLAGYFHDMGRSEVWTKADPNHAARSVHITERILKATDLWADERLRDTVCRLIANHSTRPETADPLACALWDADCYESARSGGG